MARVKISEYTAKTILNRELNIPWKGMSADKNTDVQDIVTFFGDSRLVIKVDQGVKKRGKQGLVGVNLLPVDCIQFIEKKSKLGYSRFLIEELVAHDQKDEHYLSIERVREGMKVLYSENGGIEIEENWGSVVESSMKLLDRSSSAFLVASRNFIQSIISIMDRYHFSFLEINPLIILSSRDIRLLDCAVLVDDAGMQAEVASGVVEEVSQHPAEKRVRELDISTPASLKLKVMNPSGRIWMLLSGGGASLVLADEVADLGLGKDLGNYGEYSGSPSTEDTYLYTRTIVQTMLSSKAKQKVLIIAGGVANFTDVAKTFKGIIQALQEAVVDLQRQHIKVFVRRGGPNQEKGLKIMKEFLEENHILGQVSGPELELTEIVHKAINSLSV